MENKFIRAEEVAQELSVSKPYAYKLIRQLNEELKAKGFITITGRVNRGKYGKSLTNTLICSRQGTVYRYDQPICKRGIRKTLCIPTGRSISGNQENWKEQSESRGDKGRQCGKKSIRR